MFADFEKQAEKCAYPMPGSGSLQKGSSSARLWPLDAAGSWGLYSSRRIAEGAWGLPSHGRFHQRDHLPCLVLLPRCHDRLSLSSQQHSRSWSPVRWQWWCWKLRRTPWRDGNGCVQEREKGKTRQEIGGYKCKNVVMVCEKERAFSFWGEEGNGGNHAKSKQKHLKASIFIYQWFGEFFCRLQGFLFSSSIISGRF